MAAQPPAEDVAMTCNFRVGQKVVCVDDADCAHVPVDPRGDASGHLKAGEIYVIESIKASPDVHFLRLVGVFSGWAHVRFRAVVTSKTDISIFKTMLNPQKQGVPA